MTLKDLTAYAKKRYHIREEFKWMQFPTFSVLTNPQTNRWAAVLIRLWDSEHGVMVEKCDIKCRELPIEYRVLPYLSSPLHMKGSNWVGVTFTWETDETVVRRLFDGAMGVEDTHGYTVILETPAQPQQHIYRDTPLSFDNRPANAATPDILRRLHRLYDYGSESFEAKCNRFFRQAKLMERYEDEAPWDFSFISLYPTYQDLTTAQQRGYFAWRTHVRRGDFQPIATSAAYLYVYELLCGIGAASPEDVLAKLNAFAHGFLDAGYGDERMRQQVQRWRMEYAIVHHFPPEIAFSCAPEDIRKSDEALTALRTPQDHDDDAVFEALCYFYKNKLADSPVVGHGGKHLFSAAWRKATETVRENGKDWFSLCFGEKKILAWRPLFDALCPPPAPQNGTYVLNSCRSYHCRGVAWLCERYDKLYFDKKRFNGFLHAADAFLRRALRTKRYLRENPEEAWANPVFAAVLADEKHAKAQAAVQAVSVDFSRLDKIREDAVATRDSLLTEEELRDDTPVAAAAPTPPQKAEPDVPLDTLQAQILRLLLNDKKDEALAVVHAQHRMPSVVADGINEALFDEIGDAVVLCEDDKLSLIEEYREDLLPLFT